MYLPVVLLLLALVGELQVADADCEIKHCVDNTKCDIQFIDCANNGKNGTERTGTQEENVTKLDCNGINEFKGTDCQYYKIDKEVNFITLTEIKIPEGVKVTIGQLDCKGDDNKCKVLKLGPKAVPPIPHLYFKPGKQKFKISASGPDVIIKFTCDRKCHNKGGSKTRIMKRIVDGAEAKANAYPFMARLKMLYSAEKKDYTNRNPNGSTNVTEIEELCNTTIVASKCGGSILQELYVLTAQHCVLDCKMDFQKFLDEIDRSPKDGMVEFHEFQNYLLEIYDNLAPGIADYWFRRFNFNKLTEKQSIILDKQELKAFFLAMKKKDYFPGFQQAVNALFDEGDDNPREGRLTFGEFFSLLRKYDPNIDEEIARHWFNFFNQNQDTSEDEQTLDIEEFNKFYAAWNYTAFDYIFTKMNLTVGRLYLVGTIVTVGDHSIKNVSEDEQVDIWVGSGDVTRRDNYDPVTYDNDAALLKLFSPIELDSEFRYPICMPPYYWDDTDVLAGSLMTVTGWGVTENAAIDPTDTLREGNLTIIPDAACTIPFPITERMICMTPDMSKSCKGDSGGPGFCKADDNYFYEVGVVSFGFKDDNGKWSDTTPEVYAKVTQFLKWIAQLVKYLP